MCVCVYNMCVICMYVCVCVYECVCVYVYNFCDLTNGKPNSKKYIGKNCVITETLKWFLLLIFNIAENNYWRSENALAKIVAWPKAYAFLLQLLLLLRDWHSSCSLMFNIFSITKFSYKIMQQIWTLMDKIIFTEL